MKKNMSNTDRVVRILIAIVFVALYATGTVSGMMANILLILAAIFVLTSFVSFCPLYTIFGIRTLKQKKD